MKKNILVSSMLVAVLIATGSVTSFAADVDTASYGYLAGQQKSGTRHTEFVAAGSSDADSEAYKEAMGIVGGKYSEATHLDTDELLSAGILDQATIDNIKAYASAKHDKIHSRYSSMGSMTDEERHAFYASVKNDGSAGDSVDDLLNAGLITQEQAAAINTFIN